MAKLQPRTDAQSIQTSPVSIRISRALAAGIDTRRTCPHTCAVAFNSAIRFSSLKHNGRYAAIRAAFSMRICNPCFAFSMENRGGGLYARWFRYASLLTRPLFSAPAFSSAKAVI